MARAHVNRLDDGIDLSGQVGPIVIVVDGPIGRGTFPFGRGLCGDSLPGLVLGESARFHGASTPFLLWTPYEDEAVQPGLACSVFGKQSRLD